MITFVSFRRILAFLKIYIEQITFEGDEVESPRIQEGIGKSLFPSKNQACNLLFVETHLARRHDHWSIAPRRNRDTANINITWLIDPLFKWEEFVDIPQ